MVKGRSCNLALVGVCFGVFAGLTEGMLYAIKGHFELALPSQLRVHSEWIPALAYALVFGLLGVVLAVIVRCLPRARRETVGLRGAVVCFGFLYFVINLNHLDLVLHIGMNVYAEAMLALGLSVAVFSRLAARPQRLRKIAVRGTAVMAVIVAVWAGAVIGRREWDRREMLAQLPATSPDGPNVLLIVWDTVRAKSLSLYGYPRATTPTLQRLAGSAVVFDRAVATAPWTLPSHVGMFTGRMGNRLPQTGGGADAAGCTTLAEFLHRKGYATAGFVANRYYCSRFTNLDRGFADYHDCRLSLGYALDTVWLFHQLYHRSTSYRRLSGTFNLPGRETAGQVNEAFLGWLSGRRGRPFFAFLNYFDAHSPYLPPPPMDEVHGPHNDRDRLMLSHWTRDAALKRPDRGQVRLAREAYHGCIAYQDRQVGHLLQKLDERGVLENTLVIITSDHGEQFAEHDQFGHGTGLYQPQTHVPLLMVLPGGAGRRSGGLRVAETVSLGDLPVTVVDVLELSGSRFPGESLARHWRSRPAGGPGRPNRPVLARLDQSPWTGGTAESPHGQTVVDAVWLGLKKYIRSGPQGGEELYDLENDPAETRNLAALPGHRNELRRFRDLLRASARRHPPAATSPPGPNPALHATVEATVR